MNAVMVDEIESIRGISGFINLPLQLIDERLIDRNGRFDCIVGDGINSAEV